LKKLKEILLIIAGSVLIGLGALGVFLPILPTTPFVLAAAGCFAGNPAIYAHVMKIPFVSEYISSYKSGNAVPRRTITISLLFLWLMLVAGALSSRKLWLTLLLAAIGAAVTVHLQSLANPRVRRNVKSAEQSAEAAVTAAAISENQEKINAHTA
jgi:uncharacterized membrane protein YbaN (DUF454 family)